MAGPQFRVRVSGENIYTGEKESEVVLSKEDFATLRRRLMADLDGVDNVELVLNTEGILRIDLVVDGPKFTEGFGSWLSLVEEGMVDEPDASRDDVEVGVVMSTLEGGGLEGLGFTVAEILEELGFDFDAEEFIRVTKVPT
ncbi:hypothetical protein DAERI_060124 [Deinococcus aerius]|uniref:Uncharacterized protein n=1 Tax=Deinococcus aerius TaxID=200253 RepID=A0A2I9CVA9_9DEIO|nr:hypothetical protein [Deinococcus aerius]GBF05864.1 hypothetical protein DAERI_060124 [Deinococcus aerius]